MFYVPLHLFTNSQSLFNGYRQFLLPEVKWSQFKADSVPEYTAEVKIAGILH